jgi:ATP-dependent DNA helicase DinG
MLNEEMKESVMDFYRAVQQSWQGFKSREGQLQMVEQVTAILASAKPADAERDGSNIGVIQGQTGVGKTVGYVVPSVVVGKALKKRVLISTATVALQEQLFTRDLPALQKISPVPFNFALAKGRGRYACNVKLEGASGMAGQASMFEEPAWERPPEEQEIQTLKTLLLRLEKNEWDGDKDSLRDDMGAELWSRIAADRHSCLGRNCPRFSVCPYYKARKELVAADVIVANHDLVLAALAAESRLLPDPEDTLYIFDEGHHLPEAAISRFASAHGLAASLKWLDKLDLTLRRCAAMLPGLDSYKDVSEKIAALGNQMRTLFKELAASTAFDNSATWRFAHGQLPAGFAIYAEEIESLAYDVLVAASEIAAGLNDERKESEDKDALNKATLELGFFLPRLENLYKVWELLRTDEEPPIAKWVERQEHGRTFEFLVSAAPTSAAKALAKALWNRAAAVCVTSATIKTLGDFNYYLKSSGLNWYKGVSTLDVPSPFNYERQGVFVIPAMRSSPTDAQAHTLELCLTVPAELGKVQHGALVLFTSKKQMEQVYNALPAELQQDVLMQNTCTRQILLKKHRDRIADSKRSILFGLQSFGEGLDLPGKLCEVVVITKLPFSPPDSPVEEARAEWLEKNRRNPFAEISVPAVGLKMQQWAGRGIRTETDTARIVCMDTRLSTKAYGKQIMDGLPPFRRETGTVYPVYTPTVLSPPSLPAEADAKPMVKAPANALSDNLATPV